MLSSAIDPGSSEFGTISAQTASASKFYKLKVSSVRRETRDAIVVAFHVPPELEDRFRFVQGQFLTVRAQIEGVEVRRSYSICSAVQDGTLRVGIKRTPGGVFSTWAVEHLRAGDTLDVMPPDGRFHTQLCPNRVRQYVAFAVGSGITPIFSIIKTTLIAEPKSKFTLFYGDRSSASVMLRDDLSDLKDSYLDRFSLFHVMTREHQDTDLLNGRITADKAEQLLQTFCKGQQMDAAFLCGPFDMMQTVSSRLRGLGIADEQIKMELFTTGAIAERVDGKRQRTTETAGECRVGVIVDGVRHAFTMLKGNESVLDAGLRQGLELRHSCKSGVCATCRAKLLEGQVDMDANYALEDYEVARGFILCCQSYPVTDELLIDFDQDS
jgi:ring-1,2-phenylacetyl-CoA epoxidase subunit PaaE